jgi:hypothetical protein
VRSTEHLTISASGEGGGSKVLVSGSAILEHRLPQGRDGQGLVFGKTEGSPFVHTALLARAKRAWADADIDYVKLHTARHAFA